MDESIRNLARVVSNDPEELLELSRKIERSAGGDPELLVEARKLKLRAEPVSFKDFLVRMESPYWDNSLRNCGIQFGDEWIASIQCSSFHYCKPRVDRQDPKDYTHYEMALIDSSGLVRPPEGCPHRDNWEQQDSPVAGRLSVEQIQSIFEFMYVNYGEPSLRGGGK